MEHLQYCLVMLACLTLTLPLEFAFGARVWRRPRRLITSLTPAFVIFVTWDLWATHRRTWVFSRRYTVGWTLPGGMAVEELLFFTVVPICALLTFESVRNVVAGTTPVQQRLASR